MNITLLGTDRSIPGAPRIGAFLWAICTTWLACLCFLWPAHSTLQMGAVSASSFVWAQLLLPRCRVTLKPLLSPLNWLMLVFFFQLVVMPVSVLFSGAALGLLPHLPSEGAINFALLLITVAFWTFCASVQFFRRPHIADSLSTQPAPEPQWIPSKRMALLYVCLGLVGVAMTFGSLDRFIVYLTNPVEFLLASLDSGSEPTSLSSVAAGQLAPFLGFGWVLLWCRLADSKLQHSFLGKTVGALLIGLVAISYALSQYNRGAFAVPMVAIATVIVKRAPSEAFRKLAVVATVLALVMGE